MVEFAILLPFLFSIVLGGVDFGRVFGQNASIYGAAREAARQAVAYDPVTATNPNFDPSFGHDTAILAIAQGELGSSVGPMLSLAPLARRHDCTFTAASPPPASLFPTTNDTGYLFICWAGTGNDGVPHVRLTIAWTMSLLTPFVQNMVGTPHLHAVVEATEQQP